MSKNYTVYKHTCPNGKVYIGITGQNPLKRWNGGHGYNNNPHFKNAIIKYGWYNIAHEILFDGLTKEEAERKEVALILKHKSNESCYGYNLDCGGGCNKTHSEETKAKIRRSLQGHFVTDTTKRKMTSIKLEAFGETHSLAEWAKITGIDAKTIWARIFKYDIPIEEALTTKELRGKKISKAVVQYSKDMLVIKTYKSALEAQRQTGIMHIGDCCNGNRKTAGGYIWRYQPSQAV